MRNITLLLTILLFLVLTCPQGFAAPIKLRYVDHNPETSGSSQNATIPFLRNIEKATNNAVEFELYFAETLLKTRDTWDGLKNGLADVGWLLLTQWPGKVPMTDAFGLPGLNYKMPGEFGGAMWKAYEKYPEMQDEYLKNGVRPLVFFTTEPFMVGTTKKQVLVLEDLKGLKMRVLGGTATTQMKALGGVPIFITMPESYISLEKGVVNGMSINCEALVSFRLYETIRYLTYAPMNVAYFSMAISDRKWKQFPAELQQQIMDVCGYEGSIKYANSFHEPFINTLYESAEKAGKPLTAYHLPPDEYQRWLDASEPAFTEYYRMADSKNVGKAARSLVKDLLNGDL